MNRAVTAASAAALLVGAAAFVSAAALPPFEADAGGVLRLAQAQGELLPPRLGRPVPGRFSEVETTSEFNARYRLRDFHALPEEAAGAEPDDFRGWRDGRSGTFSFYCGLGAFEPHHYRFVWRHSGAFRRPGEREFRGHYIRDLRLELSRSVQFIYGYRLSIAMETDRVDGGSAWDPVPRLATIVSIRCESSDGRSATVTDSAFLVSGDGVFSYLGPAR